MAGRSQVKLKQLEDAERQLLAEKEEKYKEAIKQKSLLNLQKYQEWRNRKKLGPVIGPPGKLLALSYQSEKFLANKNPETNSKANEREFEQNYTEQPNINFHLPVPN